MCKKLHTFVIALCKNTWMRKKLHLRVYILIQQMCKKKKITTFVIELDFRCKDFTQVLSDLTQKKVTDGGNTYFW